METEVPLTDEVLCPVMEKYDVDRAEAVKRLQLLFKSGIMDDPNKDGELFQTRVDAFLEKPSKESEKAILAQVVVSKCLDDKKFVREYDRKNKTNFAKMIRLKIDGEICIGWDRGFKKFEEYVIKTVVSAMYS
jgi:hypothetical protein